MIVQGAEKRRGYAQSQGVQMGSPFGLVHLFDVLLCGPAEKKVSDASTTAGVGRLAGAGARTRKGAGMGVRIFGHVACAAATNRMLPKFS